jgi:DNA replication and repair protein RecF
MLLKNINLQNFRNHKELSLELSETMYISGRNGAGKSSIIEAIHLLLTLKTFRQQNMSEVLSFSEDYFRISAEFDRSDIYRDVVFFYKDKRVLKANNTEMREISNYTTELPVVCYSPGFDTILAKEHADRRSFLDRMVFYTDHNQLNLIKNYNALLLRKRAELEKDKPNIDILNILNEKLTPISASISENRVNLIDEINNSISTTKELGKIFMPNMFLTLGTSVINNDRLSEEIEKKRPLFGCHKDLLYIKQDGRVLEKFQSFGQKKSALLFILYHLALHIEKNRKCDIILLLDDFEAGLDDGRCGALSELFFASSKGNFRRQIVQTGITNRYSKGVHEIKL